MLIVISPVFKILFRHITRLLSRNEDKVTFSLTDDECFCTKELTSRLFEKVIAIDSGRWIIKNSNDPLGIFAEGQDLADYALR